MDNWLIWSLVFFGVGLVFTMIEVLVPSGGILGIIAVLCLGGSIAVAYGSSGLAAVIVGGVELVCVPVVIALGFKVLPRTRLGKQLILSPPASDKYEHASDAPAGTTSTGPYEDLLHREGVVVTALRPSGTAEFDGRRISVVSNGEVIENNRRVRVVLVEGARVVVEAVNV